VAPYGFYFYFEGALLPRSISLVDRLMLLVAATVVLLLLLGLIWFFMGVPDRDTRRS
jgi:hypothetical protein